ncbi:MAG: GspE/PulE family protein [Azonexus sp.]
MSLDNKTLSGGVAPPISSALLDGARQHAFEQGLSLPASLQVVASWPAETCRAALASAFSYAEMPLERLREAIPRFDLIAYRESANRSLLLLTLPDSERFILVLSDPFDISQEGWVRRQLDRQEITNFSVGLTSPGELAIYLAEQEADIQAIDRFDVQESGLFIEDDIPVITLSSIETDDRPAVKLVNSTLYDALKLQASDIHLACDEEGLQVHYRIDGVLVPITRVAGMAMADQIVSRIKVMAELDIAERRVPQDGRFRVRVNAREIDFRVSIMPSLFGEDAVLRLLDRRALTEAAQTLRLDHLGLDSASMAHVRDLAARPHGMLLVTGPTGSGKTTTLYAAITEIHTGRDKIVTIEDPVEYRLPRVLQIPVNEKKGLTFARGLRSLLRHDPDKIMVGEIRDEETAQIAVQAALTGHLVLTSVHANNVYDVLGRFMHMGVDPYSFAAALNGIVAQRLMRLNCLHCAVPAVPESGLVQRLAIPESEWQSWQYRIGHGCTHCRGTGYRGRKAIAEVLVLDDVLREHIAQRSPITTLKQMAQQRGLVSMQTVALSMIARGETTLAELFRVAS